MHTLTEIRKGALHGRLCWVLDRVWQAGMLFFKSCTIFSSFLFAHRWWVTFPLVFVRLTVVRVEVDSVGEWG